MNYEYLNIPDLGCRDFSLMLFKSIRCSRCSEYNAFVISVCLSEYGELKQRICAGTCHRELVACGMDINAQDV